MGYFNVSLFLATDEALKVMERILQQNKKEGKYLTFTCKLDYN